MNSMVKNLLWLGVGAFFFAMGLADLVGNRHFSHYILMGLGLALGVFAITRISKSQR